MPKRLPYELLVIAGLALGSCSGPSLSTRQRDEVTDIADDVADGAIAENDKIRDLEARVQAIEAKLAM